MKKINLLWMTLFFAFRLYGQFPAAFNYQAVLRDVSGNLRINTNVNLRLDVVQTSVSGTVVYAESFAVTTNSYGLINVQMGKGTGISGSFGTIDWSKGPYFVRISVDGTEMGTSQLLAVPFAKFAEKAGNGFSGSYNDLTSRPNLGDTVKYLKKETDPVFAISVAKAIKAADTTRWGKLAFSGNYDDLTNKPTIINKDKFNLSTGFEALISNTSGSRNAAYGFWVLNKNTTGLDNSGFGTGALMANTAGEGNSAFGTFGLYQNTTGIYNTAMGASCLELNTTGEYNTANGNRSMHSNTTGSLNTAVGTLSLFYNKTGNNNTALGYYSLLNSLARDNTAIGCNSLQADKDGYENVALGGNSLKANINGNANTAIGFNAMSSFTGGTLNTAVGCYTSIGNNVSNSTAIGNGASVNVNDKVRIGNSSITVIEGQVPFTSASDVRLKKNIRELTKDLAFIMSLHPVEYQMISGDERINFGFLAQDIEKILGTNYSLLTIGGDSNRTLGLRYTDLIAPLVKTVQLQQHQIESQQQQIEELKQLVEKLLSK